VCINCGHKTVRDHDLAVLPVTNQVDDYQSKLSVKVKIIYICEYDEYKAYEVGLKPGEYTYQEFIGRIKEKVQMDRALVKVQKRMFVLADLIAEGTVFGQMFTNE